MDNPCTFLSIIAFMEFDLPWPSFPAQLSSKAFLVPETTLVVSGESAYQSSISAVLTALLVAHFVVFSLLATAQAD